MIDLLYPIELIDLTDLIDPIYLVDLVALIDRKPIDLIDLIDQVDLIDQLQIALAKEETYIDWGHSPVLCMSTVWLWYSAWRMVPHARFGTRVMLR